MIDLQLKAKAAVQAHHFHPWVFSQGILPHATEPQSGEVVRVFDDTGQFVAHAHYSQKSKIALRLLAWNESEVIDVDWYLHRIAQSIQLRLPKSKLKPKQATRLVYSESDRLPGLIVDAFGTYLVVQILSAGMERVRDMIFDHLTQLLKPDGILELSDAEVRKLEGLESRVVWQTGADPGETVIVENGVTFTLNLTEGQKTGFYLDQTRNRATVASYTKDKDVLDAFCYSGGFGLHALKAGAKSVRFLDNSQSALEILKNNLSLNGVSPDEVSIDQGDVFQALRKYRDAARSFDVIILDPPKFAPTHASLNHASRAYKDINLWAMKLLRPDGILATFSCSGALDQESFLRIIQYAAMDAGRDVQILERLSQAPDHPVRLAFPESDYLKGFILRIR